MNFCYLILLVESGETQEKSQCLNEGVNIQFFIFVSPRWGDGAGVYFSPAVITSRVSELEVKVTFLADEIERTVELETGVITVDQLKPGNLLTVKHDVYSAYEVTAELLKFPTKRGSRDYDYQVKISATDSEPQNNEDSRVVSHEEVTLNGKLEASV